MRKSIIIHLRGDGRCDNPGHNAKYLTYSLMDKNTSRIVAFSVNIGKGGRKFKLNGRDGT